MKHISGKSLLFLRSLFWTVLGPGMVTLLMPFARWRPTAMPDWNVITILSLLPIILGAGMVVHCIWNFAVEGQGTLSPLDAPRRLVVQGLYRYVRNPMYVGVLAILLGETVLFRSAALHGGVVCDGQSLHCPV